MATPEQCRRYRQRLRIRALAAIGGNVCAGCKLSTSVQLAHLIDTGLNGAGRGMERRMLDVIRHPNCYAPLCRGCHQIYDRIVRRMKVVPF